MSNNNNPGSKEKVMIRDKLAMRLELSEIEAANLIEYVDEEGCILPERGHDWLAILQTFFDRQCELRMINSRRFAEALENAKSVVSREVN
jgi:hypothetical protein